MNQTPKLVQSNVELISAIPPMTYTEELRRFFKTCRTAATEMCAPVQNAKKELCNILQTAPTKTSTRATDVWQAYMHSLYKPSLPKSPQAVEKIFKVKSPAEQAISTSKFTFNSAEWAMYEMGNKTGYKWFLSGESRLLPLLSSIKANPFAVTIIQTPFWLGLAFLGACLVLCFTSTARTRLGVVATLISLTAILLAVNIACYSFIFGPTSCSFSLLDPSKLVSSSEILYRGLLPQNYVLPTQELPGIRSPAFSVSWNNYDPAGLKQLFKKTPNPRAKVQISLLPGVPKENMWGRKELHFAPPFSRSFNPELDKQINFRDAWDQPSTNTKVTKKKKFLNRAYHISKEIYILHSTQWWAEDIKHPKWSIFDKRWTFSDKRIKSYNRVYLEQLFSASVSYKTPYQLKIMLVDHLQAQNPNFTAAIAKPIRFLPEVSMLYAQNHPYIKSFVQSMQWATDVNNPRIRLVGDILIPTRASGKAPESLVPGPLKTPKGFKSPFLKLSEIIKPNFVYSHWIDSLATRSKLWQLWARGDADRTIGNQNLMSYNRILLDFEVNPKKNKLAFWRHYFISYEWFKGVTAPQDKSDLISELSQINPLPAVRIHKMGNIDANSDLKAHHQLAQMLLGGAWLAAPANIVITCSSLIGSLLVIVFNSVHLYSASSPSWRTYFVTTKTRVEDKAKKFYKDWYNFKRLYYVHGGIGYLEYTAKNKLETDRNILPLFNTTNMRELKWWRRALKRLRFTEIPVIGGFFLALINVNLLPSGQPAYVVGFSLILLIAHVFYHKIPHQLNKYRQAAACDSWKTPISEGAKTLPKYSWLVGDYERQKGEVTTLYARILSHKAVVHKCLWGLLPGALCGVYFLGHWLLTDIDPHRFSVIVTCSYAVFCACLGFPLYFAFVRYETLEFFSRNVVNRLIWSYRQTFFFCYLWATFVYIGTATSYFDASLSHLGMAALTAALSLYAYFRIPADPKKHYIHRVLVSAFLVSYVWLHLYVFGFFLFHGTAFAFTVGCVCLAVAVCSKIPTNLYKERVLNPNYALVSRWNKSILAFLLCSGVFWTIQLNPSRGVNSGSWLPESYAVMFVVWFVFLYALLTLFSNPISVWRGFALCLLSSLLLLWSLARCDSINIALTALTPQLSAAGVLCFWVWSFIRLWRYFVVTGSISAYISYTVVLLPSILAVQSNLSSNYIGISTPLLWTAVLLIEILTLLLGVAIIPKKLYRFSVLSYIKYAGLRTQSAKQLFFIFSVGMQLVIAGLVGYTGEYHVCVSAFFSLFSMFVIFVGALLWSALSALTLSDRISDLKGALTTSRFLTKYTYTYGFLLLFYCLSVMVLIAFLL